MNESPTLKLEPIGSTALIEYGWAISTDIRMLYTKGDPIMAETLALLLSGEPRLPEPKYMIAIPQPTESVALRDDGVVIYLINYTSQVDDRLKTFIDSLTALRDAHGRATQLTLLEPTAPAPIQTQ